MLEDEETYLNGNYIIVMLITQCNELIMKTESNAPLVRKK